MKAIVNFHIQALGPWNHKRGGGKTIQIVRFLGLTPATADIDELLKNLIKHLRVILGERGLSLLPFKSLQCVSMLVRVIYCCFKIGHTTCNFDFVEGEGRGLGWKMHGMKKRRGI